MEYQGCLTIETFLSVAEMIAAQLRIKEADRWTANICQLKYASFTTEFPEVSDPQFLWAAEQWLQDTGGKDFLRYPTWKELMASLYRSENGLANRSWGFKEDLPLMCQPSAQQVQLLPAAPQSIASSPDPNNTSAYVPFHVKATLALPPEQDLGPGLTPLQWADYLHFLSELNAQNAAGRG